MNDRWTTELQSDWAILHDSHPTGHDIYVFKRSSPTLLKLLNRLADIEDALVEYHDALEGWESAPSGMATNHKGAAKCAAAFDRLEASSAKVMALAAECAAITRGERTP